MSSLFPVGWLSLSLLSSSPLSHPFSSLPRSVSQKEHKRFMILLSYCCCSVTKLYPTVCNPTDCSKPASSVLHCLSEFAQIYVHMSITTVSDALSSFHPLLPPSFAFSLSQHQSFFQWVGSWHKVGYTNYQYVFFTLTSWCEESTHWKRSWCWERLKARGEGMTEDEMVGWHPWLNGHGFEKNSRRWWRTGKPGMLYSPWGLKESDTFESDWATEQQLLFLFPVTM